PFRRFEHFRNFAETAVAHDEAESLKTDFAPADMFMSIYPRAASGFGIIDMHCNQTIAADEAIKFAKCFSTRRFVADVVTRGENMRGIETNTQPLRPAYAADDVSEVLEFAPQR